MISWVANKRINYNYVQDKTLNKCLIEDDNDFSYKLTSKEVCNTTHRDKLFSTSSKSLQGK